MRLTVMTTTTTTTTMMMLMIMILMMTTRETAGQLVQECRNIDITSISVGQCGVWAVDERGNVFYLNGSYGSWGLLGDEWQRVPGEMKQVEVGYNVVWGISKDNMTRIRRGITKELPTGTWWQTIGGSKMHVFVSGNGPSVMAIDSLHDVSLRSGTSFSTPTGSSWSSLGHTELGLQQISIGPMGIWAVNVDHELFYLDGSFGGFLTPYDWIPVPGQNVSYVSSGVSNVVAISEGKLYIRSGMSYATPTGSSWILTGNETEDWVVVDHLANKFWGLRHAEIKSYTPACSEVAPFC